jgi:hypothetical protein
MVQLHEVLPKHAQIASERGMKEAKMLASVGRTNLSWHKVE